MNVVGWPFAVTWKLPAVPISKVVAAKLVMVGCSLMVSVKVWLAALPTPLVALITSVYTSPVPAAGVPLKRPALVSVSPWGRLLAVL